MTKMPALVRTLGELDARGVNTIDVMVRALRESDLLSTTKRGRGAPEITLEDAATVLIAMCLPGTLTQTVNGTRDVLALQPGVSADLHLDGSLPEEVSQVLTDLRNARTPLEATCAIIRDIAGLPFFYLKSPSTLTDDVPRQGVFRFFLDTPAMHLVVGLHSWTPDGKSILLRTGFWPGTTSTAPRGRRVQVELDLEVFEAVHNLLYRDDLAPYRGR